GQNKVGIIVFDRESVQAQSIEKILDKNELLERDMEALIIDHQTQKLDEPAYPRNHRSPRTEGMSTTVRDRCHNRLCKAARSDFEA
ncbi:hypothetical protein PENSUB_8258, partial [Penicillium subrubescens]